MKNIGKIFEQNWKLSCPKNILLYRPPDAAQSFEKLDSLRFSKNSPCDFFMFNGETGKFYTLELKTFKGSCSFERDKNSKGIIHYHQIESLKKFSTYVNVISGFVLDFRNSGLTYFLSINDFYILKNSITKKSFNENDINNYCNPILISKNKLKINFRYDIQKFMEDSLYLK